MCFGVDGEEYHRTILISVMNLKTTSFIMTADVLQERKTRKKEPQLHYEFQYYGNLLAEKLNDQTHALLYMKLAKEVDRSLLEQALDFVHGAANVKNKAKLFMWWLDKLRKEKR
jgi:hypothetical protein